MFLLCRLYLNRIQISKVRYKCVNFDKSRRSKIHCRSFFIFSIHFKILKFFFLSLASPSLLFFTVNFFTLKLRNLFLFFRHKKGKQEKDKTTKHEGGLCQSQTKPNESVYYIVCCCCLFIIYKSYFRF